jgi:predicted permease
VIRRRPLLGDLDREIRDHLEAEIEENIARGMSEEAARQAALRKFGNVTRVKEEVRGVWVPRWADHVGQDARDAVRRLRRNPVFAVAIIATLALGIGLTTTIYSVVQAVLLKPLSYPHPDRVVWLTTQAEGNSRPQPREPLGNPEMVNELDFAAWQAEATLFEHMIAYIHADATLVAGGEASRARVVSASEGFWDLAGARPVLGGLPSAKDRQVLVLSDRLFRGQFHGDPRVIGQAVTIDGQPMTIGAVLAPDFRPQLPDPGWRPGLDRLEPDAYRGLLIQPPAGPPNRSMMVRIFQAIGELRPDVTIEQAHAELEAIHTRNRQRSPQPFGASSARLITLQEKIVGSSRFALGVLLAAAICVLLVTCANVANLLLSRTSARQKEIALRMSMGSGPLRVIRQLLAESVAYALLGGVGGVVLARWLIDLGVGLMGPAIPRLTETTLDVRVLGVAMAVSLGTALVFGLGPAVALCRTNVQEVLKDGARTASVSPRRRHAGRAMIAVQLALTVVLLVGAGLMLKSVWRMTSYPAGFAPDQILTMRVDFRGPRYRDDRARHDYAESLLARAQSLAGVRDAAITTGPESTMRVIKEGEPFPFPGNPESRAARVSAVSPDFGRIVGMPLLSGRWFEEIEATEVVMINEALARRDYPGMDPVGRRILLPWLGDDVFGTIVGMVGDLKYSRIDADAVPEVFFHHARTRLFGVTLTLRIDGDPLAAAPGITKALAVVDPSQSIFSVQTMETALAESIAPRRFNLLLLGTFALVALVLAVLGVYGVVAYAVAERTHEIGIRLALGAKRQRVVRMIVGDGMLSVLGGLAIGLLAAVAATRLLAGMLYDVDPADPTTFVLITLMSGAIAFIACAAPALNAARVDPVIALRAE